MSLFLNNIPIEKIEVGMSASYSPDFITFSKSWKKHS